MREETKRFYGIDKVPFSKPPRSPFLDPVRKMAIEQLRHLVARRGFGVLSAAPGCGKTSLLHYLAAELVDSRHQVTYVPFSFLEEGRMLQFVAAQMGLEPSRGMAPTLRQIHKHLNDIQPVNPVLILDEVERLEVETIRMIRQIFNDRPDTAHHCTLILAGTDSFVRRTLSLQINEPLRQRITLYARLQPFGAEAAKDYLDHCLRQAGVASEIFEPSAVQLIQELADGIPRIVNNLAEAAMDLAAEQQSRVVTLEHVRQISEWTLPPQAETFSAFGPSFEASK